jgi:hypothetical protein
MKRTLQKGHRRLSQFLYGLSLVFMAFGLFNLGWVVWPAATDAVQFSIPAGNLPAAPVEDDFISLSAYALAISWPRWMRRGEPGTLRLQLTDLDHTPPPAGDARDAQVVLAEPALFPLQVEPLGGVQATLGDDQELLLTWTLSGDQPGQFAGKLFVSFGFLDEAQGSLTAVPVAVVDLNIRVVGLWGAGSGLVLWFGFISLVLWGALFLVGRLVAGR